MQRHAPGMMTILAAMALGGCADAAADREAAVAAVAAPGIPYACLPAGSATASAAAIMPQKLLVRDVQQRQLVLDFGKAPSQHLYPVGAGAVPVYANSGYAWKAGAVHSRLTDIVNIQAYDCVRSDGR